MRNSPRFKPGDIIEFPGPSSPPRCLGVVLDYGYYPAVEEWGLTKHGWERLSVRKYSENLVDLAPDWPMPGKILASSMRVLLSA